MEFQSEFISVSSSSVNNLSWIYLVDWILALILGLAFVFYFNRLVGFVISLLLKLLLWSKYGVRINMESLRVLPLGGLISIRNLTVVTLDHTTSMLRVNLTWRYWIFNLARLSEYYFDDGVIELNGMTKDDNQKLSLRLQLLIDGMEVFWYNRGVAYDNMMEVLQRHNTKEEVSDTSSITSVLLLEPEEAPFLVKLLPLTVRIRKGAVVLGNSTTPSILVASYKSAHALVDIGRSPCAQDKYRLIHDVTFDKFQVSMKPNISHHQKKAPVAKTAKRYRALERMYRSIDIIARHFRHRRDDPHDEWRGLRRYVSESDEAPGPKVPEYGKYSLILDSVSTRIVYYYDVPGLETCEDSPSPEFGVHMELSMATIHYGPWADRQRVGVQQAFFPSAARDGVVTSPTEVGSLRKYDGFRLLVSVKDEVIFRIPTREASKDAQAAKHSSTAKISRPFGWFELKMEKESTILSFTSYVATEDGWANRLVCTFQNPELRSSVNHDLMFMANTHVIECDIGYPLKWNGPINWSFANVSDNVELFLLRDHTILLSDMLGDFGLGPQPPYENYRPFSIDFDWDMRGYRVYLNVNENNIINNPVDFTANKYISFQGNSLQVELKIPLDAFTKSTTISYSIFTPHFDMILDTPPWHTVNTFIKNTAMGLADNFCIDGLYTYFSAIEINTCNYIVIRAIGDYVTMKFHGFFVRYLFNIKENYMGDHKHFKTFEEYTAADTESAEPEKYVRADNDVDILFTFQVRHGLIVLPYNFYSSAEHIGLQFDSLDVDLRFTDYFSDLQADFSEMRGRLVSTDEHIFDIPAYKEHHLQKADLVFEDWSIHSHRMFGLPPDETTYYCKWDFSCNEIAIDAGVEVLTTLDTFIDNFGVGFMDQENGVAQQLPIVYDAANFSMRCPVVQVKLGSEGDYVQVDMTSMLVNFNDIANLRYSVKIDASIPEIKVSIVESGIEVGSFATAVLVSDFTQKADWLSHRQNQQAHIRQGDSRTHRVPFLLFPENRDTFYVNALGKLISPLSLPDAAVPLNDESRSVFDGPLPHRHDPLPYPTYSYNEADYMPAYEVDPACKYGCVVADVSEVTGTLTPAALSTLARVFRTSPLSPEALIDKLHHQTVTYLKFLINPLNVELSVRVVCPNVAIDFCVGGDSIEVLVENPSAVLSKGITREPEDFTLVTTKTKAAVFYADRVSVKIRDALSATFTGIEFCNADTEGTTATATVEGIDVEVQSDKVTWLAEFGERLQDSLKPALESLNSPQNTLPELVYHLTAAAEERQFEHDPEVLTKPAYILRACEVHPRHFDKWKVMTRIRYTLDMLPASWRDEFMADSAMPETAFADVLQAFLAWRSWESNQDQREMFFREIFDKVPATVEAENHAQVTLDRIDVKVWDGDDCDVMSVAEVALTVATLSELLCDLINLNLGIVDSIDSISVVGNVGSYEGKISPILLDKVPQLSKPNTTEKAEVKKSGNTEFFASVRVGSFNQLVRLPYTSVELGITDLTCSSQGYLIPDRGNTPITLQNSVGRLEFTVWAAKEKLVSTILNNHFMSIANVGDLKAGSKHITMSLEKCHTVVLDRLGNFPEVLHQVNTHDVAYLQGLAGPPKPREPSGFHMHMLRDFGDIRSEFSVGQLSFYLEALTPLKMSGAIHHNEFSVSLTHGVIDFSALTEKFNFDVDLHRNHIFGVETAQQTTAFSVGDTNGIIMVKAAANMGYTKLVVPQAVKTLETLLTSQHQIQTRIDRLTKLVPAKNKESPDTHHHPRFAYRVTLSNDYIGVLTFFSKTRYSFELEGSAFTASNVIDGTVVPHSGELDVPTARIAMVDRHLPVGLSNIVDVNVSVKVSGLDSGYNLQVESQHCRICFSPQAVIVMMNSFDALKETMARHPLQLPKKSKKSHPVQFNNIHVLSYNFCLGWLFGEKRKDYPGIILGAERFFAVSMKDMGKLSLMEGFLSVANGPSSHDFYSSSSEKLNLNRAFLPNMQLTYVIEEVQRHMHISITGDELDVKFLSNSMVILERTVISITRVQKALAGRKAFAPPPRPKAEQTDYMESLSSRFSSVECIATFAGSNVLLYRLSDDDVPPSLFLHSPAVKIATSYKHQAVGIKHVIKCEVLATSSDNTLYASCVPVVMDIVDGFKGMMRKSNTAPATPNLEVEKELVSKDFNVGKLLLEVDFHFGLKIDSQRLALSCEPTAKVAAIVGLEGIYFQSNSGARAVPAIVSTIQINELSASLQHIYSREVSGLVKVDQIIMTSSVAFDTTTNVLSSGAISKVDAYINVKQYQDVDLFKDIWFPKKQGYSTTDIPKDKLVLASNKNISSRFREVSTTYAIPWVLTFVVTQISAQVDFGQSLGNFALDLDQFWAVSKKCTDWSQDLRIGLNLVRLVSEGRLGGHLMLKDAFLHTAISWKLDDTTLDVPLIAASLSLEKLQTKVLFDYHVFALANVEGFRIHAYNQKKDISISKDHLYVTTQFKDIEVYITSLAASNFLDIYNTVSRMVQDNKRLYRQTLRDSNKDSPPVLASRHDILNTVKKLETNFEVVAGKFLLHVYPSSMDDSKVLVIQLDKSSANFQQNEYLHGIANDLKIQFNDLKMSLSVAATASEEFIQQCNVDEYVEYAQRARGGHIFVFPRFMISMKSFQKYQTMDIEYLYQSSFGGTVDIRWNLGLINFIREMYAIHKKALDSRGQYRRAVDTQTPLASKATTKEPPKVSSVLEQPITGQSAPNDIDQAISNTITKVSGLKFTYTPLAPPIIEAPRLKELGNATPPLEWFGVHRNKIPAFTHQMAIVSLQQMIHEVELQYSKILGKA